MRCRYVISAASFMIPGTRGLISIDRQPGTTLSAELTLDQHNLFTDVLVSEIRAVAKDDVKVVPGLDTVFVELSNGDYGEVVHRLHDIGARSAKKFIDNEIARMMEAI